MSDIPKQGLSAESLKDINGYGVLISGWMYNARMPDRSKKQKFGLQVIDNSVDYMSSDLKYRSKSKNGVSGSGSLEKKQDDFSSLPANFEVTCI